MSGTLQEIPPSTGTPARRRTETWSLTWQGVATVTRLELRQRVRSTRWVTVLVAWALVLVGLAVLIHHAVFSATFTSTGTAPDSVAGAMMFGLVVLLVLSLGGLIAPALSATSVNGDRAAGVLATLQATLLSPAEIALGKLLAAWATALALLAAAIPVIGWAYVSGGTPAGRLAVTLLLLAVVLLVVCAIGLGWSAIAARTASSAVLTYLSVAFLGLGLPVLFGLLVPVVTTTEPHRVRTLEQVQPVTTQDGEPAMRCVERTEPTGVIHSERIWWLLAANPYVIIADASPRPAGARGDQDVLTAIRSGVRELRLGEPSVTESCGSTTPDTQREARREALGVVWPYGLAADLAVGAGFAVITVRRLRAPARALPRGSRVA
jgi:ABC-type transport system involved in multi-copper enzyme maturation permease subunit